jgi:hypothetical protein
MYTSNFRTKSCLKKKVDRKIGKIKENKWHLPRRVTPVFFIYNY